MSDTTRAEVLTILSRCEFTGEPTALIVDEIEKVYSDHYGDLTVKLVEALARAAFGSDE